MTRTLPETTTGAPWFGLYPIRHHEELFTPDQAFVEGRGLRVRDAGGRWYLDARASLRTLSLGYDHPRVVEAIVRQARTLAFNPTVLFDRPSDVSVRYAEALAERLPAGLRHVRFASSGSQATDTALLLSRFLRHLRGQHEKTAVIGFRGGFHGSGAGPCALTGNDWLHEAYGPVAPDIHHVAQPGADEPDHPRSIADRLAELGPDRVTAVLVEPIVQSNLNPLSTAYLAELRALCTANDVHLIVDEISTGFGRTGAYTRCSQLGVVPDMLTLSKGMTSGYVPLSCLAISDEIYSTLYDAPWPGCPIGSTSDGHPLAMAAGLAVLEAYEAESVFDNVHARSAQLARDLGALRAAHPSVLDVRGTGMLWMVDLGDAAGAPLPPDRTETLRRRAEELGVLFSTSYESYIGIWPPLILTAAECDEALAVLDRCLGELEAGW